MKVTNVWTLMNRNGQFLKYKNDTHGRFIFNGDSKKESAFAIWTFASLDTARKAVHTARKVGYKGCLIVSVPQD